jgi:hypothetical protein
MDRRTVRSGAGMTDTIILPFPAARRRGYIRRHARRIASLSPIAGERHLIYQLGI